MRDDLLGRATWSALDSAARGFLATAEKIFRDHRADAAFDFSPVVINLAKAYEVQLDSLLGRVAKRLPEDALWVNIDGQTRHLVQDGPFTLGQTARSMREHRPLNDAIRTRLTNGAWAAASLPPILQELAEHRNAGAHRERVSREQATALRDRHLGVGSLGIIVEMGKVE